METIRIPTRYSKQISRLSDKDKIYIFDSLFLLAQGQNVTQEDDISGDILELIFRDSLMMEKKNTKKESLNVGNLVVDSVAGIPPAHPPTYSHSEGKGSEMKGSEFIPASAEKNEPLEEIIRHWNNDFKKKIASKNRTIAIGENIFKQCRGVTTPLIGEYKKLRKKMSDDEIKQAMFNYAVERNSRDSDNNDYATHCFSLFDFLKQSNGAIKFLNQ